MAKTNQIKKFINGEIADADEVNQVVENAGAEGGVIPYDSTTHERDTTGSQSLGNVAYPWGSFKVNQDAELVEVDISSPSAAASVAFKNLRKFNYLKDVPSSYSGQGGKTVRVNAGETGLEFSSSGNSQLFTSSGTFTAPAGVSVVFLTMIGGGAGGGNGGGGTYGGGSGAWVIRVGVKVTAGNSYAVTVGAGGGCNANGTASSFPADNVTISCNGAVGINGGTATGSYDAAGTTPGGFAITAGGNGSASGAGGGSPFGKGGVQGVNDGNAPDGYGSGGGDSGSGGDNARGRDGMVFIEW